MLMKLKSNLLFVLMLLFMQVDLNAQQADSIKYQPPSFDYEGGIKAYINSKLEYSKELNKKYPEGMDWVMNFMITRNGMIEFDMRSMPDTNNMFEVEVYNILQQGRSYWKAATLDNAVIVTDCDMNMHVQYNKKEKTVSADINLRFDKNKLAENYMDVALTKLKASEYKNALPYIETASDLSPGDMDIKLQLGNCKMNIGDTAEACEIWRKIKARDIKIAHENIAKYCGVIAKKNDDENKPNTEIKTVDEVMPEFPGGQAELVNFIIKTFHYPEKEREANIEGTVYVSFVVKKDGNITHIRIKRGIKDGLGLERESIRMVKCMPRWKPGTQNGKPVDVQFTLPVKCKLRG